MFFKFLDNLRTQPEEYRQRVAVGFTVLVGLILIPLWLWNMDYSRNSANTSSGEAANNSGLSVAWDEFQGIGNPLDTLNRTLEDQFRQPVVVTDKVSTDQEVAISIEIKNEALADLVFPQNNIYLQNSEDHEKGYRAQKVTDSEGRQLVPVIPAGETREAVITFPAVESGQYSLIFPDLEYDDEDYNAFSQIIDLEIRAFWLPRT